MPAVSFIPYFPDYDIDETVGDYRICNWQKNWEIATDADTREFLDRYFSLFRRVNGDPEARIAIVYRETKTRFDYRKIFLRFPASRTH